MSDAEITKQLQKAVTEAMEKKKLTMKETSKLAGIAASSIGYITTNGINPKWVTLFKLARALNISLDKLMYEKEERDIYGKLVDAAIESVPKDTEKVPA